jgi:hypothetical protein
MKTARSSSLSVRFAGACVALAASLLLVACASPSPPGTGDAPVALGLACAADASCSSGFCIEEMRTASGVSWTGGTCSQACGASSACPSGSACVAFSDGSSLCVASCASDGECRAGYVCAEGVSGCLPDCRLGFSCGATLACDAGSGHCVAGTGPIGGKCTLSSDCKSALCTPEQATAAGTTWTGGYCTQACTTSTPCGAGAGCLTYADGSSYCAASCGADSECRAGYVCSSAAKVCLPDCRQGWSCGESLVCDGGTGNCVGKMLAVGQGCSLDVDCASGLCTPAQSTASGSVWNGGYCTQACSTSACPASAVCITYEDASSYCAASCSGAAPCRTGYVCAAGVGACLPDCRQGFGCGTALTCSASTGACE